MIKNITRVGIVGAGTMGRRIAFECLLSGKPTKLYDLAPEVADDAREALYELIEQRLSDGRISRERKDRALSLLSISPHLEACVADTDLVIEVVSENLELKRKVFADIDRYADPDSLVATNSSSIPGSHLAGATGRPEKIINLHFGLHGDVKVDVMGHPSTASSTIDAAMDFVKSLNLVPILVRREIMGYAGNRVWRAIKKEVLFLLNEGYATAEDIDRCWMLEWGTPMGPCGIMDKVGLDVVRDVEMVYYEASRDPSDEPPKMLLDMISQGKLGLKSGEGFYRYPNPAYRRPGWLKAEN